MWLIKGNHLAYIGGKSTVAHKCHGKTRQSQQNKKATAKQKATEKPRKNNNHGNTKKPRQNKIATAKQKSHGKTEKSRQNKKKLRQNKKVTAKQKSHG